MPWHFHNSTSLKVEVKIGIENREDSIDIES